MSLPDKPARLLGIEVVKDRFGISRTRVHEWRKDQQVTEPILIGKRIMWPEHEVEALIRARIAGKTDSELRALVQQLMAARKDAAA